MATRRVSVVIVNRSGLNALTMVILLGQCTLSGTAAAEAPNDVVAQGALLGEWLDVQASQQKAERRFTGGSLLAVGGAGLGFGIALMATRPNNELSKGGGVALIAAGAFGTGLGIFRLVVKSEAEDVARRWDEAESKGIDELTIARFEGELYAAAKHGRRVQLLTRWLGVATAAAGVVVLVLTPLSDLSRGGRVAGYVSGGLLVLGGGINIASSLATPPPEKAWDAYQQGRSPPNGAGRLWGITPTVARGYAGVSFAIQTGFQ